MRKNSTTLLFLFLIISFITACSMEVAKLDDADDSAPDMGLITATLPLTFTPRASATPLPATAQPTVEPVSGKVTAQINVRENPSTSSESMGMLGINSEVEIIGKDANEKWYKIRFISPNGESGEGWGAAEYILTESKPDVPVVSGGSPSAGDENTNGQTTQQINVRIGPGIDFAVLGLLNNEDGVVLTGKNIDGSWLQIEFVSGNDNKGWVFANYMKSDILDELPLIDESGEEIAESTQTVMAATAAPTFFPAPDDGDSAEEPSISVEFSATNSRAFDYSSDLSSPEGDAEDWIAFHPNSPDDRVNLLIDLSCEGNGSLYVELWQGGIKLDKWGELECGDSDYALSMFRDETYQFRLYSKYSRDLTYISYNLQVRAAP
ncbi:MAG: SH3 domain-containing protein [Chloroflexi bacterium]|nr:SH3 domain-containing protein [Chloroflexota bacterium]